MNKGSSRAHHVVGDSSHDVMEKLGLCQNAASQCIPHAPMLLEGAIGEHFRTAFA
jgi:hypothetical protein